MDVKRLVAAAISLALVLSASLSKAAAPDVQVQPLELQPANPLQLNYSPNGLHCAFIAPLGSRSTVSFDGKAQGKFDDIQGFGQSARSFLFSAEGPHLAFGARRGQDMFVVVDGVEQPVGTYLTCVTESIFSPDGNQFAFSVNPQGKAAYVMLNGKPQGQYVGVHSLLFSSNSKHFAYLTNQNRDVSSSDAAGKTVSTRKSFIVYDGQPGPDQDDTKDLMFSPDGDHYAYLGRMMDQNPPGTAVSYHEHLYIDGKDSVTADTIERIVFSADGKHVACFIQIKKPGQDPSASNQVMDTFIWFDGQKLAYNYQGSHSDPPQISPDGTQVAYVEGATVDGSSQDSVVAVNGKPGDEYHNISDLHFFGDHHLIYRASQNNAGAQQKPTYFIVQDGNEAGPFEITSNGGQAANFGILITPDGKNAVYSAQDGKNVSVVMGGKKGEAFERIDSVPRFSPDGQHIAYLAFRDPAKDMKPIDRQQYQQTHPASRFGYIVVDDKSMELLHAASPTHSPIVFSPDSKHWAISSAGDASVGSAGIIVDGKFITLPEYSMPPNFIAFTADSAHLVTCYSNPKEPVRGALSLMIDGTTVDGYGVPPSSANPGMANPVAMLPDGSIHAFAITVADKSFVALTIKPGAAVKDFGASDAPKPNSPAVAANNNTNPQSNQQQQNQQQSQSPSQQADNAENQVNQANNNVQNANNAAQNAKNAGSAIGNLFKHHH